MSRTRPPKAALGGQWDSLQPSLSPWMIDAVRDMGFERMTPVQASTIPRALKNQDCVVEAVTGSGKTLAFVLPVLERISRREQPYRKGQIAAVVVAPTRELAQQINDVFRSFLAPLRAAAASPEPIASSSRSPPPSSDGRVLPLPYLVTSGITDMYESFLSQESNILVGTPGRLASFLLSPQGLSAVRVGELDVLVLDEADRLLSNTDHRKDVQRIMNHLPKQRRTHLFSATMTDAVEEMIGLGLRNPVRIVVSLKDKTAGEGMKERRVPTALRNQYLVCRHAEKAIQTIRLLTREVSISEAARFIIYFATGAEVDYFYRIFSLLPALSGFTFTSLYGDLPPKVRESALSTYVNHPASCHSPIVLLCTDVASRGVDFADIDVVIQFDPPTDPKTFSHRAGRTARAGRSGNAVCLLGEGKEEAYVDFLSARKIPLVPHGYIGDTLDEVDRPASLDPAASDLLQHIRHIVLTDRDLADKAAKAFVSSLRAYTKHEAAFIFRLPELDLGSVAVSYGLLRMPAMPEVRDWRKRMDKLCETGEGDVPSWEDAEVDWDAFAYASKSREEERLRLLATRPAKPDFDVAEHKKKQRIKAEMREAWSEQKERKVRKEDRREKKDKRKQAEWEAKQAEGAEVGIVEAFKRRKRDEQEDEKEYKALKKEIKEEKVAKRSKRDGKPADSSMFDGLD